MIKNKFFRLLKLLRFLGLRRGLKVQRGLKVLRDLECASSGIRHGGRLYMCLMIQKV